MYSKEVKELMKKIDFKNYRLANHFTREQVLREYNFVSIKTICLFEEHMSFNQGLFHYYYFNFIFPSNNEEDKKICEKIYDIVCKPFLSKVSVIGGEVVDYE